MAEEFDVFLSYNNQDRELARRLREELRERGVSVWMDEGQLSGGQPWIPEIEAAIQKAPAAAIVIGPAGIGKWQERERQICLIQNADRDMPVLSVLLEGCPDPNTIPLFLQGLTWVDLRTGSRDEGLDHLARTIEKGPKPPTFEKPAGSPTPLKLHNLPFLPLGDLFKGRGEDLQALETSLQSSSQATAIVQPQAIHGLGGIGKTRLAVEHAWRSVHRYDAAFFVVADSPDSLRANLAGLAVLLNLPEQEDPAQEKAVGAVERWLREHSRWLVILDNVDTPEAEEAVVELLPRLGSGHVLITSRRSDWPPGVRERPIEKLSQEEAIHFLLQRTGIDDSEQASKLAAILDGLPLALEQAGAYIKTRRISFARYLEEWESQREKVLAWHNPAVMQYPAPVAVTWQKTFLELGPTARAVLRLAAFLAPEPIPREVFEQGDIIVENAVTLLSKETGMKPITQSVEDAILELDSYSMVRVQDSMFTVHRMVQEVIRGQIPEKGRKAWIEGALRIVDGVAVGDPEDVRTWQTWDVLRPHVAEAAGWGERLEIAFPTVQLMHHLATLLYTKGLYSLSESLVRRILVIQEANFGSEHPEVAIHLNNLAQLLQTTNRLSEAEPMMRRALAIGEVAHGSEDPIIAIRLNNLAQLLRATNRLSEAEPLMRRALAINEAAFGNEHPKFAINLNNLAQLLWATNRLSEAEPMMRRALEIDEAAYGSQHPHVARDLNNLALLLQATNRLSEAEPMMRRGLEIEEAAYGSQHPRVAIQLNNLASLLQATNRLSEAEPMMRRALEIDETAYGDQHPDVARDLNNLAKLLQATNRLSEGEPMMRRAVEIFERILGPDHQNTRIARENLEVLLRDMAGPEGEGA